MFFSVVLSLYPYSIRFKANMHTHVCLYVDVLVEKPKCDFNEVMWMAFDVCTAREYIQFLSLSISFFLSFIDCCDWLRFALILQHALLILVIDRQQTSSDFICFDLDCECGSTPHWRAFQHEMICDWWLQCNINCSIQCSTFQRIYIDDLYTGCFWNQCDSLFGSQLSENEFFRKCPFNFKILHTPISNLSHQEVNCF